MAFGQVQAFRRLPAPQHGTNAVNKAYGQEFTGGARPPRNMAKSFIVFRHAQTRFNPIEGRDENGDTTFVAQGRGIDPPIDECGVKQALAGGFALRHEDIRRVICSPSQRAVQTAIYAKIVNNAEFTLNNELQEHAFLEHEGKMLPGKAFRGPYPGIEDPVEFTEKFIIPGLGLVHNEKTVVVTHGGWFKGGAGVLGMKLSAEDVGNAVPVRLEDDGSGWKATRLRAILHLALCQVQETADVENAGFGERSNEGLDQILGQYGLSLSLLKPRSMVSNEDKSATMEMADGSTRHFDLDLRTRRGEEGIPWRETIEDVVEQILIAKPDVGAVHLLISSDEDYSDPDGPATTLLRRVLDEFVQIGERWNVDFEDATIPDIEKMAVWSRVRAMRAAPAKMRSKFFDRVALVTGASGGIGQAIAWALLENGFRISLSGRDIGKLQGIFGEENDRIHYAHFDAYDKNTVEGCVASTLKAFGRIDALVNNAGYGAHLHAMDDNDKMLDDHLQINFKAHHWLIRECMPHLEESGDGRIINMSSMSGKRLNSDLIYGPVKAALEMLTTATNQYCWGRKKGVRVTSLCPGLVNAPMSAYVKDDRELMTQPETVAQLVRILLELPGNAHIPRLPVCMRFEPSV